MRCLLWFASAATPATPAAAAAVTAAPAAAPCAKEVEDPPPGSGAAAPVAVAEPTGWAVATAPPPAFPDDEWGAFFSRSSRCTAWAVGRSGADGGWEATAWYAGGAPPVGLLLFCGMYYRFTGWTELVCGGERRAVNVGEPSTENLKERRERFPVGGSIPRFSRA